LAVPREIHALATSPANDLFGDVGLGDLLQWSALALPEEVATARAAGLVAHLVELCRQLRFSHIPT
jgi:hypothetical protein